MLLLLIRRPTLICIVKALFIKWPYSTTLNRSVLPFNEYSPLENFRKRKRFRPRQELQTKRRDVCRSDGEQRQIRRKVRSWTKLSLPLICLHYKYKTSMTVGCGLLQIESGKYRNTTRSLPVSQDRSDVMSYQELGRSIHLPFIRLISRNVLNLS